MINELPIDEYVDFQFRLNTHAKNMSLNVEGIDIRRYVILPENRGKFPEIDKDLKKVSKLMSTLEISELILPNEDMITSVNMSEEGIAIQGCNYEKFKRKNPEDALRIDEIIKEKGSNPAYQ